MIKWSYVNLIRLSRTALTLVMSIFFLVVKKKNNGNSKSMCIPIGINQYKASGYTGYLLVDSILKVMEHLQIMVNSCACIYINI